LSYIIIYVTNNVLSLWYNMADRTCARARRLERVYQETCILSYIIIYD